MRSFHKKFFVNGKMSSAGSRDRTIGRWKFLDKTFPLEIIWYTDQLHLMGEGKEPNLKKSALGSVLSMVYKLGKNAIKKVR
jgi:hypothetical protein